MPPKTSGLLKTHKSQGGNPFGSNGEAASTVVARTDLETTASGISSKAGSDDRIKRRRSYGSKYTNIRFKPTLPQVKHLCSRGVCYLCGRKLRSEKGLGNHLAEHNDQYAWRPSDGISPTHIKDFLECREIFRLKYLLGYREIKTPMSLIESSVGHAVIERMYTWPMHIESKLAEWILEEANRQLAEDNQGLRRNLSRHVDREAESKSITEKLYGTLLKYWLDLASTEVDRYDILETEKRVDLMVLGVGRIKGVMDLLVRSKRTGNIKIMDHKIMSKSYSSAASQGAKAEEVAFRLNYGWQVRIYRILASFLYPQDEIGFFINYLVKGEWGSRLKPKTNRRSQSHEFREFISKVRSNLTNPKTRGNSTYDGPHRISLACCDEPLQDSLDMVRDMIEVITKWYNQIVRGDFSDHYPNEKVFNSPYASLAMGHDTRELESRFLQYRRETL